MDEYRAWIARKAASGSSVQCATCEQVLVEGAAEVVPALCPECFHETMGLVGRRI